MSWQDDGQPWHPDHVSKRFKKLAAQAGVPVVTLHEGGRHTGNSLMQDAGVDYTAVQVWWGELPSRPFQPVSGDRT